MSERMKTCAAAYNKGVQAHAKHQRKKCPVECPYGETKRELKAWWLAGYHDADLGEIDMRMYSHGNTIV